MSRFFVVGFLCLTALTRATASELISHPTLGVNKDALGVWYSRQDGWILHITSKGIQRYQFSDHYCYPSSSDGPTFMGAIEYQFFKRIDSATARFDYLEDDGFAIFDALPALPKPCSEHLSQSSSEVFEIAVSMFQEFYPRLLKRSPRWYELADMHRETLRSDDSETKLYSALSELIDSLSDSHTKLYAKVDGASRRFQSGLGNTLSSIRRQNIEQQWLQELVTQTLDHVLLPGGEQTANERILWGKLEPNIGYIQIFTMGGFTTEHQAGTQAWAHAETAYLETLMTRILTELSNTDALILDLSNNRGGYDVIARQLASYFTRAEFDAYQVKNDLDGPVLRTYSVSPSTSVHYPKPIYLLTSDVTVSGGEIATLSLKRLANVVHVGTTTRGSFSTPLAKPLPNGWYLELSNELFVDMSGTTHEGSGIAPDIELTVYDPKAPVESHASCLFQLRDIVRKRMADSGVGLNN